MLAQTVFLFQFAALMLAVGVVPFVPESAPFPLLGFVIGATLLVAAAPLLFIAALRAVADIPLVAQRRSAVPAALGAVTPPTAPGTPGAARPRAPSLLRSALA